MTELITALGTGFKAFLDTFGASVLAPTVVFLLSLALKVEFKKALRAFLYMAIGLTAFNIILGQLWGAMNTVMLNFSANVGKTFDVVDVGWPAAAAIVYNNALGMMYFIIGLLWNLVLFYTKVTDTFQPTDIWNYYYFAFWGILVQFATGSLVLGILATMFQNLFVLFIADVLAPALQEYYGYEGLTCTCICVTNVAVLAVLVRFIIKKFNLKEVELDPASIQKKLGLLGEPAIIGLLMGLILGIGAYVKTLNTMATWAGILSFALTLGAMLVIYPAVSGMFVKGLIPVSQTLNARIRNGEMKRDYMNIGIDPAVYFGETATLTTGLLLIPILVVTAIILPGNRCIPIADIPAMPFMAIGAIAVFQGNILNATITGTIWYSLVHYIATDTAAYFTQMAQAAGTVLAEGQTFINSWCISAQPPLWLMYKCFSAAGALKYVLIALLVAVYVVCLIAFKKNRKAWYMAFGASEEFTDKFMNTAAA